MRQLTVPLAGLAVLLTALPAEARPDAASPQPARPEAAAQAAPARAGSPRAGRREAAAAPAPLDPGAQCRAAIAMAEQQHGIAPGLLGAIARVESGRADTRGGGVTPWPWTINAEGQGRYFETKAEAIVAVQALQARGVQVIDVGCMQVNLLHHPAAFASLEDAFDPLTNARYGGLFLKRLHAIAGGDWEKAAGHYHSYTPDRAEPYRAKVLAVWSGAPMAPAGLLAGTGDPSLGQRVFQVNGTTVRALTMAGRPDLTGQRAAMLEGLGPVRMTGQQMRGRPVMLIEVAEARPRR